MSATQRHRIEEVVGELQKLKRSLDGERQEIVSNAASLLSDLDGELARLIEQVRWLEGKPYRRKREDAPPGQLAFALIKMLTNRLEGGDADADADAATGAGQGSTVTADEAATPEVTTRKKRKRRGKHLPVKIVECRLDESERACPCCGKAQAEIGFDAQKRFVHEPAKVFVLEERRYKYACRRCGNGVSTADPTLPPKPVPGSMASSSLLAFIVVAKVLDGLPIERIAKRLRRHGVDLATSTLGDWFGRTATMLALLHRLLGERLRGCTLVSLDDTPLSAQSRGHPKNMVKGRQWIYLGDVDQVAYAEFTPDWKGSHPRRVLEGL